MRRGPRSIIAVLLVALCCRTPAPIVPAPPTKTALSPTPAPASTGRRFVALDAAASETGKLTIARVDTGADLAKLAVTTLADAELRPLLARLEPLPQPPASAPALRPPSAAPTTNAPVAQIALVPLQGKQIADAPPAPLLPAAPAKPDSLGPLTPPPEILPSGEVAMGSEVHVRFPDAMVPVADVGAAKQPPATITPAVPGNWRWVDTRVARFTATTRLPGATTFTVTVPAGTRELAGRVLEKPVVGTFSTRPIELVGLRVRTARADAPLLLELDHPFDPVALAKFVRVEHMKKPLPFEVITLERAKELWARDPQIKLDKLEVPPHYLVVAPKPLWPAGANLMVILGAGAPSKEGPRPTTVDSEHMASTVRPFMVRGLTCENAVAAKLDKQICPASRFVQLVLTNPVTRWRGEQVTIDGKVARDEGGTYDIRVLAPKEVGRTHTIEVAADLIDVHGQPLTGPRRATFTTKRATFDAYLNGSGGVRILDPRFEIPQWYVEAAAIATLRIQLYRVEPADYFAYERFESSRGRVPGKLVYDKQHPIGPRHGGIARIDLRPALTDGIGHVVGVATAVPIAGTTVDERTAKTWIQVTKLGVTARFDGERVHSWASRIDAARFLEPAAGATTTLLVSDGDRTSSATSDPQGRASFEFPAARTPAPKQATKAVLVVASGTDSVFQPIDRHERSVRTNNARWYVTDDRFTYKPGEPVYVKGWVRWSHDGVDPDITAPAAGDTVAWTLHDSKNAKLGAGTAKLTAQGGFDLETTLPANANLGTAYFRFESRKDEHGWPIEIEEFRTPTFSMSLDDDVSHGGATPLFAGEQIEMTANAKYYGGGGLAGARIKWSARLSNASYVPPGWDDYSFAPASAERYPRYRRHRRDASAGDSHGLSGASSSTIAIAIPAVPLGEPAVLQVDATVTDIDRATIRESSRPIVVHPSSYYVGVKQRAGDRDELELIVTDVDGRVVPGVPIDVVIEGIAGQQRPNEQDRDDQPKVVDTQKCKTTSAATPVTCVWKRSARTIAYSAVARVADPRGRSNATRFYVPWWNVEEHGPDLTLVADKPTYLPGDVAKLELFSATVPAHAIVSYARQGVVSQRRIAITKQKTMIEVPIEASFVRNVHVIVDRVARRSTAPLPDVDSAAVELRLDPEHGRLAMTTRSLQTTVGPGAPATFEVTVKQRGKPVAGAEVALMAVDEAVLAVSDKRHADPLAPFYFDVEAKTDALESMSEIADAGEELTKKPGFDRISLDDPAGSIFSMGGGRGGMRGHSTAVPQVSIGAAAGNKTRRDFRATAVWSPRLLTDANGRVTVSVTMPDSLTRFRIVALATAGTRNFGKAEGTIATQRPLSVRATAPRFLSQGDAFSLPIIVQNLDTGPRTIDVGVRASNLTSSGPAGKRVTIPAGQRAELRFDFRTQGRGRATIQTVAASGELFDASQIDLPVYQPVTTEAFATYGIVDGDKPNFEQLTVPDGIVPDVGGVEAELFASQLSSLTDAFWYLQVYPFECAEQRSGRMLATAAMADVLEAFAAPDRPSRKDLEIQRARDIRELERDYNEDGWGYFRRTGTDSFVTQQVVAALAASGTTGKVLERGIGWITTANAARISRIEALAKTRAAARTGAELAKLPSSISLAASELATLATIDRKPVAVRRAVDTAMRLHASAKTLGGYPIDAKARLLSIVAKQPAAAAMRRELLAQLLSAAREEAATASITTQYTEDERLLLVSNAKTTALVLDALIREAPEHALIPKLARGLLDGRKRGRWMSTQENLAVLQAMRRYFDTYEKVAPEFTGKVWVGAAGYAEHALAKRDARAAVRVAWPALSGSSHQLALAKTGAGRMYYRVGIQYAPAKLDLPPVDAGFVVRRSYTAVEDPEDVTRTPDGHYKVKLGATVLVHLEVLSTVRRHGVALVDPLPAGFEPINTRLAISERVGSDTASWDHVNLRDNRSEAFAMSFAEGTRRFTYTVRANTPGTFAAAPAKAEEMYAPETFGRTSGTLVIIE